MTELATLYEGEGWRVVNKPAGMLVIPGRGEGSAPVLRELLEARRGGKVFIVHRLDRDTSGALAVALEAAVHRTLSMAFEAGKIRKRYLALVEGRVEAPLEISLALAPARRGRMRPARPGEAGKNAITRISPVETFERASLIEVEPLTGRTHQIRVHLQAVGHPLLVDHQYGRAQSLETLARTPLHAWKLEVPELEGVAAAQVEAPLPDDMARTVEALRRGG